jgi:hypothetical protein
LLAAFGPSYHNRPNRQRIGNQVNTALIFARADFIEALRARHRDRSYHFVVANWRTKKTESGAMKTTTLCFVLSVLTCFALLPAAQSVVPPPDGGYPGFNTAEGQGALLSVTTGQANTAVGWFSLRSTVLGSFNTAIGAGTLLSNLSAQNTATGAGALLANTSGTANTAAGALALFNNTGGNYNTAFGANALLNNDQGNNNTAIGISALYQTEGDLNTAVGEGALFNCTTSHDNTAVGAAALFKATTGTHNTALGSAAGSNVTTANNVICIGAFGADISNSCFIDNIAGVVVTGDPVVVDANGQLGVAPAGSPLSANELLKQQRVVQELKATTERQAAVIALQEGQIRALTAGLQKVSAQLEACKPAPQMVSNP